MHLMQIINMMQIIFAKWGKSTKVYYSSNAWGGSTDPKNKLGQG